MSVNKIRDLGKIPFVFKLAYQRKEGMLTLIDYKTIYKREEGILFEYIIYEPCKDAPADCYMNIPVCLFYKPCHGKCWYELRCGCNGYAYKPGFVRKD